MTASRNDGTEGTWYPTLAAADDGLSAESSVAFDAKAVAAAKKAFEDSLVDSTTTKDLLEKYKKIQEDAPDLAPQASAPVDQPKTTTKDKD